MFQRAIVTARTLRDPTEQMLLKLDSFSALEGERERRNSLSSYATSPLQVVNNETEYIFVRPFFSPRSLIVHYGIFFFILPFFHMNSLNLIFIKTSATGVA